MAILNIQTGEKNEILRQASEPVTKFDKSLAQLLDDMRDTLKKAKGLGIAAPQVGANVRAAICIFNYGTEKEMVVDVINPVFLKLSKEMQVDEEGCLSLPEKYGKVARHLWLVLRYQDRKGRFHELKLENLNAVVVQHETDHLDGKLFIDRLVSPVLGGLVI